MHPYTHAAVVSLYQYLSRIAVSQPLVDLEQTLRPQGHHEVGLLPISEGQGGHGHAQAVGRKQHSQGFTVVQGQFHPHRLCRGEGEGETGELGDIILT